MNHDSHVTPLEVPEPAQIADYLRKRGWRREPAWRGAQVWTPPEAHHDQILLPPDIHYRDDHELLVRALHSISKIEEIDYRELLRLAKEPLVDIQYFHTHPPSPSGTVPLLTGIETLEGIRSTFTLAAQAVFDPRPKLGRGKNIKKVNDFLRKVRLGPTSAGSYILSSEVPLTPPSTDLLFTEPPSERVVVRAMKQALTAAHQATKAAEEKANLDAFDEAMSLGVSARLCDSLTKFGGHDQDQKFSIKFEWSPLHQESDNETNDLLEFSHQAARVLGKAGERLRELEYAGTVRLTGTIIATERKSPLDDGFVKVRGMLNIGGKSTGERTLLVRLRSDAYTAALSAHARGDSFEAEGRFSSSGNRRELIPSRIAIAGRPVSQ